MTLETKILRDLDVGRSTAGAIAERLGIHTAAAEVILQRLGREGHVTTSPLGPLTIWHLTHLPKP